MKPEFTVLESKEPEVDASSRERFVEIDVEEAEEQTIDNKCEQSDMLLSTLEFGPKSKVMLTDHTRHTNPPPKQGTRQPVLNKFSSNGSVKQTPQVITEVNDDMNQKG